MTSAVSESVNKCLVVFSTLQMSLTWSASIACLYTIGNTVLISYGVEGYIVHRVLMHTANTGNQLDFDKF